MKQIILIILLFLIIRFIAIQINNFELYMINQTSMNACMASVDCD